MEASEETSVNVVPSEVQSVPLSVETKTPAEVPAYNRGPPARRARTHRDVRPVLVRLQYDPMLEEA